MRLFLLVLFSIAIFCRNEVPLGNYYLFQLINSGDDVYVGDVPGVEGPEVKIGSLFGSVISYDEVNGIAYIFGGYQSGKVANYMWAFSESSAYYRYVYGNGGANLGISRGVLGIFGPTNFPGARAEGVAFFSSRAQIFYAGFGVTETVSYKIYGDLWAFDLKSSYWAWISGSNSSSAAGIYGTFNVTDQLNAPGARIDPTGGWDENDQVFYLAGGMGYDVNQTLSPRNDVWSFNTSSGYWTWIGGNNTAVPSVYGSHGVFGDSLLGGIYYHAYDYDPVQKRLYLFGGYQLSSKKQILLMNNMWAFDLKSGLYAYYNAYEDWLYNGQYVVEGYPSLFNFPAYRYYMRGYYNRNENAFYVYGGKQQGSPTKYFGDFWRFDFNYVSTAGAWSFIAGQSSPNVQDSSSDPGSLALYVSWYNKQKNIFFIAGGRNSATSNTDTWSFSGDERHISDIKPYWYPANSDSLGVCGVSVIGISKNPVSSYDEVNQNVYSFGGETDNGVSDALWSYSEISRSYSLITGFTNTLKVISYGPRGAYSPSYYPGGRAYGGGFYSAKLNIFFICFGIRDTSTRVNYADLWAYDLTNSMWAFLNGDLSSDANGVYVNASVYPGARSNFASAWDESSQTYFIIGGLGKGSSSYGFLNDVWSYNATRNTWQCLIGQGSVNQTALIGSHGQFGNSVFGGKAYMISTFDKSSSIIYMYGGTSGNSLFDNDVWGFSTSLVMFAYFQHVSSGHFGYNPSYGTLNIPSLTNNPPIRYFASSFYRPDDGCLYVFGGRNSSDIYADMWKFDFSGTVGLWTWVGGHPGVRIAPNGVAGLSTYDSSFNPGSRYGMVNWYNSIDDRFWIGYGAGKFISDGVVSEGLITDTWFSFTGWFPASNPSNSVANIRNVTSCASSNFWTSTTNNSAPVTTIAKTTSYVATSINQTSSWTSTRDSVFKSSKTTITNDEKSTILEDSTSISPVMSSMNGTTLTGIIVASSIGSLILVIGLISAGLWLFRRINVKSKNYSLK